MPELARASRRFLDLVEQIELELGHPVIALLCADDSGVFFLSPDDADPSVSRLLQELAAK